MFIVFNNKIKVHSFFSRWLLHPTGSENGKKNELYFRKKESMEAVMKSYKILFLGQHQFLPERHCDNGSSCFAVSAVPAMLFSYIQV
ncbi:uncharacterized protein isoform X3 [Rhodnius prolixus]|uniref:uncharacterized protein isoform X3 n=1 Tax=Rhodnius prolixus TaxID=13249 RepID=UPI003D1898B0